MQADRARKPRPGFAIALVAAYVAVLLLGTPGSSRAEEGISVGGAHPTFSVGGAHPTFSVSGAHPTFSRLALDPDGEIRRLPAVELCDYQEHLPAPGASYRGPCLTECCDFDFLVRGYYLDDQRIQWTGQETTLGVEAVLDTTFKHYWDDWEMTLDGEFYLNQPIDRNILVDTPERASYAHNFDVETLEISKLFLSFRRGNLLLGIGKMETPFGRADFPLMTNARLDAPFIRTESILWRETGMLVRYDPGCLVADVALTNGSEDRDTNSSKALVTRVGLQQPGWAVGVSLKTQDGIGSESQKMFRNHVGADCMVCRGPWILSGEVIHDEYGFRRPGFDPLDITWGRSIYFRDQNLGYKEPITGIGYYVNFGYRGSCWATWLNYGEFHPQQLGDPRHDVINRRGIVKFEFCLTPHVKMYTVVMKETDGYVAQDHRLRRGTVALAGFQWER